MLLTDLLRASVVDADGGVLGPVRDVRARRHNDRLELHSIVVGGHQLAHSLGYIDGRSTGPWLIRKVLTGGAGGKAVVVPARLVTYWGTPVRLSVPARDLPRSTDEEAS